jgi:hypothetical protein
MDLSHLTVSSFTTSYVVHGLQLVRFVKFLVANIQGGTRCRLSPSSRTKGTPRCRQAL